MTDMQILPNSLYVVAHRSCKTTVCVKGMQKSCSTHFPLASSGSCQFAYGVLTKTFAMSVLYLKRKLNCSLGAINGEDASKAGGHGSQRARFPVSLRSVQLARFPVSLRIGGQLARLSVSLRTGRRSHASRLVKVKQLSARHLLQPLKPRHVVSREWLTEFWVY